MDEPSKIVNVEDDQVVVEYKGERKLLEPKYIDSNWNRNRLISLSVVDAQYPG